MSEDHEGMSALRRDKSSRHETNSRPRVPFASRQPAQTQPRGAQHQRRPHHDRTTGAWQGVLPDAGPRRRIRVGSESDHDAPAMPKVVSGTPKLRADAQQRWDDDVKRQRLRQYPPPTHAFASIGTFHWPSNEYRPDEVLGINSEALDPIRMRTECFIVWSRDHSAFKIFGSIAGVMKALSQLRVTMFQVASRNICPVRKYLSHWRNSEPGQFVHADEEHENPQLLVPADEPPVPASKTPRADGDLTHDSALAANGRLTTHSLEDVKSTLATALCKIHYLRGHIAFRIRLGIFVLTSWKGLPAGESWELAEYEEMTLISQFRGRVTEELGEKPEERDVLLRIEKAADLLQPDDPILTDLGETKPTYVADFIFKNEAGNLQLTMSWERIQDGAGHGFQFVQKDEKWFRLDRDTGRAADLLEIYLTDLRNGSAWQLDIKTSQAMDPLRIPRELKKFGKKVSITINEASADPVYSWAHRESPIFVRTSTIHRYQIRDTDCMLELSRFQIREEHHPELPNSDAKIKLYEKRWSLCAYRREWDNHFARNERLKIGDKADWLDDVEEWFPPETSRAGDDGFQQLMQKLGMIERVVREIAA